jgi:hypothetical protein
MEIHFIPDAGKPSYFIEEIEPGLQVKQTEDGLEISLENDIR